MTIKEESNPTWESNKNDFSEQKVWKQVIPIT